MWFKLKLHLTGFASSRYDSCLIRRELMQVLYKRYPTDVFVIKKANSYMTISTPTFKMLDIQYFLAPGYNLSKFLKAYNAQGEKSYFPYENLNLVSDLSSTAFPVYEAFYSTLRQVNVLEVELNEYSELIQRGCTEGEALGRLGLTEIPLTGLAKYNELRGMFNDNGWSMADYLAYYNNLDVEPMIEALQNMRRYYNDRNIEPFKDFISIPGIAGNINSLINSYQLICNSSSCRIAARQ